MMCKRQYFLSPLKSDNSLDLSAEESFSSLYFFHQLGQIKERESHLRTDPTLRKPSDSRSQEESAYAGYHLAYEVKKLMYASVVNATL